MTNQPEWPKKYSLIERTGRTFQSYLMSNFGSRFYQEQFLSGFAVTRKEVRARFLKSAGTAFILVTIIAFFDSLEGNYTAYGVSFHLSEKLLPVIALIASSSFLGAAHSFVDDMIMHRILLKLGQAIKIYSFPLVLLDKMAIDLWSDALMPRFFGEKSGRGHKLAMIVIAGFTAVMTLLLLAYCYVFIGRVCVQFLSAPEATFASKVLAGASLIILLWATVFLVLFSLPYEFYRPDFDEVGGEPTAEFVAEMRANIAQEDAGPHPKSASEAR